MTRNSPSFLGIGITQNTLFSSASLSTLLTQEAQSLYLVSMCYRSVHHLTMVEPDSALMYFAQNATFLGPISGTSPSPVTAAAGFNENATLPFQPGKTYRLRIVNTSAFAAFFFWIDGHDMRIVSASSSSKDPTKISYRLKSTV